MAMVSETFCTIRIHKMVSNFHHRVHSRMSPWLSGTKEFMAGQTFCTIEFMQQNASQNFLLKRVHGRMVSSMAQGFRMAEWSQKLSAHRVHGRMNQNFLHQVHGRMVSLCTIEFMAEWSQLSTKDSWQNGLRTFCTIEFMWQEVRNFPFPIKFMAEWVPETFCTIEFLSRSRNSRSSWQNGLRSHFFKEFMRMSPRNFSAPRSSWQKVSETPRVHGRMGPGNFLPPKDSWQNEFRNLHHFRVHGRMVSGTCTKPWQR
jgi:hypothetical protein